MSVNSRFKSLYFQSVLLNFNHVGGKLTSWKTSIISKRWVCGLQAPVAEQCACTFCTFCIFSPQHCRFLAWTWASCLHSCIWITLLESWQTENLCIMSKRRLTVRLCRLLFKLVYKRYQYVECSVCLLFMLKIWFQYNFSSIPQTVILFSFSATPPKMTIDYSLSANVRW